MSDALPPKASALDALIDKVLVSMIDQATFTDDDLAAARAELAELRAQLEQGAVAQRTEPLTPKEQVAGSSPAGPTTHETLAERVHDAYSRYRMAWLDELEEAIGAIVGEDRLRCAHVEHDSQNDNSVEIVLQGGAQLTDEERAKIKALGFSTVYNDARSVPAWLRIGDVEKEIAALVAERDALRAALQRLVGGTAGPGSLSHEQAMKQAKAVLRRTKPPDRAAQGQKT